MCVLLAIIESFVKVLLRVDIFVEHIVPITNFPLIYTYLVIYNVLFPIDNNSCFPSK